MFSFLQGFSLQWIPVHKKYSRKRARVEFKVYLELLWIVEDYSSEHKHMSRGEFVAEIAKNVKYLTFDRMGNNVMGKLMS